MAKLLKSVFFCVRSLARATVVVVIAYIIYALHPLAVSGGMRALPAPALLAMPGVARHHRRCLRSGSGTT